MEDVSLERKLRAILTCSCGFGSLWRVGENLWKKVLPPSYVQREDRVEHPGICLGTSRETCVLHAAVSMWHGTTPSREIDFVLIAKGMRYVIKDFYNDEPNHKTMFGHFSAVPIQVTSVDAAPNAASRLSVDQKKNSLRPNHNRKLSPKEKEELRAFARRFYSIG